MFTGPEAEKALVGMLEVQRPTNSNDSDPLPSENAAPRLPDARVPEGLVWPPVAGRALLQELEPHTAKAFPLARGAWATTLGRWNLLASERFGDLEEARNELFAWARLHTAADANHALSPDRCLVLNPEPSGGGRLWQIVPIHPSLRGELDRVSRSAQVKEWTKALAESARALYEVPKKLAAAGLPLGAGLDRLGWIENPGHPVYIGFIPPPRRLSLVPSPIVESVAKNLDTVLFELAFSRRTVLLGVAATLDSWGDLDAPLMDLRAAIDRLLDRKPN